MLGSIIGALIIGIILGALARLILPGRQNIPIWLTILVGVIAAFVGTLIARALGVADTSGFDWLEHIIQLILAVVGIGLVAGVWGRRSVSR